MRTASQLTRDCGYVTKLSRERPRSAYVQATADEGTRFGKLVETWIAGKDPQPPEVIDEPWCWFETFRQIWSPPPGVRSEVALGLSTVGYFVPVDEHEPHVYTPQRPMKGQLATAGRADLVWHGWRGWADVAVVADLKRSAWRYGDPTWLPQLMALGCAAALEAGFRNMKLGLYGAKDAAWEWSDVLRVEDVLPLVLEMCALPEDEPRPGPWCAGCYERKGCPAAAGNP